MKLKDKTALITGAGTGIGAAIAKRYVEEGAKVVLVGRRKEKLEELAATFPVGSYKICQGDVSIPDDIKRAVADTLELGYGKIDILVNNAGVNVAGGVVDVDLEDWKKIFDINLNGPFLLMREVIPSMKKAGGGSIINIASIGGLVCLSDRVGYCTTKAALIMMSKQAARDFGVDNIRVNAVCPGFVLSEMTDEHFGDLSEEAFIGAPMRRGAKPEEIAGICSYLASDDASYTTGSVITVDGGATVVDPFEVGLIAASMNKR
jgi:meso-butanediol dehydrogenase/(S,S)-butanediol dehydrogenase/diacetyl reductase